MAKRTATSELTDRNWDQEQEAEDVTIFIITSKHKLVLTQK